MRNKEIYQRVQKRLTEVFGSRIQVAPSALGIRNLQEKNGTERYVYVRPLLGEESAALNYDLDQIRFFVRWGQSGKERPLDGATLLKLDKVLAWIEAWVVQFGELSELPKPDL